MATKSSVSRESREAIGAREAVGAIEAIISRETIWNVMEEKLKQLR